MPSQERRSLLPSQMSAALQHRRGDGVGDRTAGAKAQQSRSGLGRVTARLWRLAVRCIRHPRYALFVAASLLGRPALLAAALRGGWRRALLAYCARSSPVAADLITPYEAGFYGQVFLFDEYEVGRLPLPPAPMVLDVGANVGFFSWRVCATRPGATVLAFEPQSSNHARLARMFEAVGIQGEACQQACGSQPGSATLYLRNSVTHSLQADWHTDLDAGAGSEQVPVTTLDAECARRGIGTVDLLKIDTEGAEAMVLGGAGRVLRNTRYVVLEYHSRALRAECRALLGAAGFRCRDKSFWGLQPAHDGEGLLLCARATRQAAESAVAARASGA